MIVIVLILIGLLYYYVDWSVSDYKFWEAKFWSKDNLIKFFKHQAIKLLQMILIAIVVLIVFIVFFDNYEEGQTIKFMVNHFFN